MAALINIIFMLIALDCLSTTEGENRRFFVEIHNVTCPIFDNICKESQCDVTKSAPNRYILNTMFKLGRTLPTNVEVRATIHYTLLTRQKIRKYLDVKMKICDILANVKFLPLVNTILDKVRMATNVPMSCPVKGNIIYNITDLIITEATFPVYTPPGHLNVTLDFLDKKTLLASYRLKASASRQPF